jgi:Fe-S oxidoreductase
MMTFDPATPVFWDKADLQSEMTRIFEICQGCRLCDKMCPSFDVLFRRLDAIDDELTAQKKNESPVAHLVDKDFRTVSDLCYQCKLCYPKCPYTPPHDYLLDFPRLLLREQAVHKKEVGISFGDRMLGNPDRAGAIGTAFPALMNWANNNGLLRAAMEATVGIHRDKTLPAYHGEPFEQWFASWKAKRGTVPNPVAKVAIYATCLVNYHNPRIGKALVKVLDHCDVEIVSCQKICCGMPNVSTGDLREAIRKTNANVETLGAFIDQGYDIVIPSPSCSLNIRQDYEHIGTDKERAKAVAARSYDAAEYLMKLHAEGLLKSDFSGDAGEVTYHLPCHLKVQNIGFKSRDLLKLLPGATVTMVQQCSGHDGQWSMKKDYYELSLKAGKKLFDGVKKQPDASVVSDCAFAHLHIEEGTGKTSRHPVELLCDAYGLDVNES